MVKAYDEATRIQALAVLETYDGAIRPAARELGIEASTLLRWRESARQAAGLPPAVVNAEKWAHTYGEATLAGAELIKDQLSRALDEDRLLPARDLQSYAIAAGIAADKHLDYRDGRKGTQINIDNRSLTLPPGLSLEELRSLASSPLPQPDLQPDSESLSNS